MSRTSKVIALSIPPELQTQFTVLANHANMTKSELFRKILQNHLDNESSVSDTNKPNISDDLHQYWQLRESGKPTALIGLMIITNASGEILIVKRAQKDEHIVNLSWVFPGSELKSLDFTNETSNKIKNKIGLAVGGAYIVGSRVIPESIKTEISVVALYFAAKPLGTNIRLDPKIYCKYKWIRPLDIYRYFTTSTGDDMNRYLASIA